MFKGEKIVMVVQRLSIWGVRKQTCSMSVKSMVLKRDSNGPPPFSLVIRYIIFGVYQLCRSPGVGRDDFLCLK